MAEYLFEQGIGEDRALLIEDGVAVEATVERHDGLARAGAVLAGRLTTLLVAGHRGIVALESGQELLVEPLPSHVTEGAAVRVRVVREQLSERKRVKLAKARIVKDDVGLSQSMTLHDRLMMNGKPLSVCQAHEPDRFEEYGWSEILDQAETGDVSFANGSLQIALTPAMTVIDVDGDLRPAELSLAAAKACSYAIRLFGISGSIGIDFPTMEGKADRAAVGQMIDYELPAPFERTAVNGFGLMQIICKRERTSLMEVMQGDPTRAAALALLRQAERTAGSGACTIVADQRIISMLEAEQGWIYELQKRLGRPVSLRADLSLALSGGYIE